VGLLPLEAWVVVGERLMSPLDLPPLALALANRCGWRLDLGGFGGLDFLDPGDVVSLDYFLSERS
jgi:hypothetical protein